MTQNIEFNPNWTGRSDYAYGKTPEHAILEFFKRHDLFENYPDISYVSSKPALMDEEAPKIAKYDLPEPPLNDSWSEPISYIRYDFFASNFAIVIIDNVVVAADQKDGDRCKVKFKASLKIPGELIESSQQVPSGVYLWQVERMSTDPIL